MTAEAIVLGSTELGRAPWLRSVGSGDQDLLREWRNTHRDAFFQRGPVDRLSQARWFEGYSRRSEDFLFLVMDGDRPCGCLGIRLLDHGWDIYNVIRGVERLETRGLMGSGLRIVIAFARTRHDQPVQAVVLATNPAVAWYERNGFQIVERGADSVVMRWSGHTQSAAT